MTERDACIILNMISGIGHARYHALSEYFGSASAALTAPAEELARVKGIGEALAEAVANWNSHVDVVSELELAHRSGAAIVTLADEDYPALLRELPDPPLALYIRGTLPNLAVTPAVAIVGSRRMSGYGNRMARKFAADAALAQIPVISGLAFGVDAAAHEATLDAGGITVGVLGGGLSRIHPQEHVPLARRIVENGGALLSEYPMNFPVSRQSFPRRNRIVAALSMATVVIEAGLDSGAIITARLALEQGKTVCAVPGRADEPQAAGCNALIRDSGAKLVTSMQDVLGEFEFLPGMAPKPAEAVSADSLFPDPPTAKPLLFSEAEEKIYAALDTQGPGSVETLSERTALATGILTGTLLALEIRDIVSRAPDGCYALK